MLKKSIQDLQDVIARKKIEHDQADIGASLTHDEDGDFFAVSFENKKFTKMRVFGLPYKDAPQQLRRYFDGEDSLIHVPTEKVIEHLGPIVVEAWVRCRF